MEEIKLDPLIETVIDLTKHKNNIRVKPEGGNFLGNNEDDIEGIDVEKKKTKCKYYPKCRESDSCPFFHPTEKCTFFPKCQYGDKCLYIHPDIECKFGFACSNTNCNYKHPKKGAAGGLDALAQGANLMNLLMMASMAGAFPPKGKFIIPY